MNYTEHDIELAERYLDGELTPEQQKAVEERMNRDETFRSLIREEKSLVKGVRYAGLRKDLEFLKDLEATLPRVGSEGNESTPARAERPAGKQVFLARYRAPLAVAASVLLLVVAYFGLMKNTSPDELYARHFQVFDSPGSGLTRSGSESLSDRSRAYAAYDLGKYDEAIGYFKLALKDDDAIVHLCLGNAYMAVGDFANAEESFNHLIKDHGGDLITYAKWYLSLTYLKQGKLERTRSILWEISDSGIYGEEAKKLLKELD